MKRTLFDDWRDQQRKEMPLFGDVPAPVHNCRREGHLYENTLTIWPDEPDVERLTWTCIHCSEVRGRC